MRTSHTANLFSPQRNLVKERVEEEQEVALILSAIGASLVCLLIVIWIRRTSDRREMEEHSITADALHTLLAANQEVLLFDVRQPLDLLADSEIIVGAKRIPPKDLLENPTLIPKEKDSVVYCTCPNDKTSRVISRRALAMHFLRVKFLKGGLAGWKAKGYPVERYEKPFQLDTRT
jgi:rhodanese-related sulfurtransferase